MFVRGFFVNGDIQQSFTADKDCVLRSIHTYPRFCARTFSGAGDEPTAFFSSNPSGQSLQDPLANTGVQLNIRIYKGETYYVYPYNTASTLLGLNIQLIFDELPAEP